VGKQTVQHYRRARELSWENLEVHGFNVVSVRDTASKPPSGEVFAVITPGERGLYRYDLMLLAEWYPRGPLWHYQ
jgi:hypothetical protein